jgi:hypothetical protein
MLIGLKLLRVGDEPPDRTSLGHRWHASSDDADHRLIGNIAKIGLLMSFNLAWEG